ncbi:MAG: PIN domain-containing protein [Candidatus Bathyarchaeia archaeon]
MKIVVDAYAWIEIFIGSEKGEKAREHIEKASEVYTPDTVLAEIARKYLREGADQRDAEERLRMIVEVSNIAPIDVEVALEAAKSYMKLSDEARKAGMKAPSLFDAIVLGTAKSLNAKILTGDEHFKNLQETLWIR